MRRAIHAGWRWWSTTCKSASSARIKGADEIVDKVTRVIDAARVGGFRIFYLRHMSVPKEIAGTAQLRAAMAWQRVDHVAEVTPVFLRDPLEFAAALRPIAPLERLHFLDDNTPSRSDAPLRLAVRIPDGAELLMVDVWDRFGEHVRHLLEEPQPAPGPRTVDWDVTDDAGQPLAGSFLLRVTVDGRSESQIVHTTR
ncbi:MAG: hypothetical protein ACRDTA_04950 [Pseudonocardiaceae bacterium]